MPPRRKPSPRSPRFVEPSIPADLGVCLLTSVFWFQEDDKPFTVRLSDESFETYELDPPPYTMQTTKKELKQIYYDMVTIRYTPTSG